MKNAAILLLFTVFVSRANAQGGVMFEAGGPGGYFSINVTSFVNVSKFTLKPRLGYSTYRLTSVEGKFHPDIIVPLGLEFCVPNVNRFRPGAGLTFSGIQSYSGNELRTVWRTSAFESLTFEFIRKEHVVSSVTAYILNEPQKHFRPWAGVSFTYLF